METPSRDGNVDTSHSCHLKIRPLKGYDHSIIQTRQDLNITHSFLLKIHAIIVGPEMMPIVGSKIYVNTQTKILVLNIKNLQIRKLNHGKDKKRKRK